MNAVALGFDGADSTKTLSHCLFRKVEGLSSSTRLSLYILGSTPGSREIVGFRPHAVRWLRTVLRLRARFLKAAAWVSSSTST